jgi:macrolide phosphotransferase
MGKSPLILAALAQAAVPATKFTQVAPLARDGSGPFDSVLLTTESGQHLVAKVARQPKNETDLAREVHALDALTEAYRGRLPFNVSRRLAQTNAGGQGLYVFDFVYGSEISINEVGADSPLTSSIGQSVAAIHNLPLDLVQSSGLAEFSPEEIHRHRVAELDRALASGKVPPILAQRWDSALEDNSLFRFQPCVIHGAFNGSSVLTSGHEVSGVLNWSHMAIGDPADDLSWIVASGDEHLIASVRATYSAQRGNTDASLWTRAQLYSELEILRWLLHSIADSNEDNIEDAIGLLAALAEEVEQGLLPSLSKEPVFAAVASNESAVEATTDFVSSTIGFTPAATGFNSVETGIVELVAPAQDFGASDADTDLVVTYSAPDTQPIAVPTETLEAVTEPIVLHSEATEPIAVVDDKTRPIELPPKGDNELF